MMPSVVKSTLVAFGCLFRFLLPFIVARFAFFALFALFALFSVFTLVAADLVGEALGAALQGHRHVASADHEIAAAGVGDQRDDLQVELAEATAGDLHATQLQAEALAATAFSARGAARAGDGEQQRDREGHDQETTKADRAAHGTTFRAPGQPARSVLALRLKREACKGGKLAPPAATWRRLREAARSRARSADR
jgi:hypothetical protein